MKRAPKVWVAIHVLLLLVLTQGCRTVIQANPAESGGIEPFRPVMNRVLVGDSEGNRGFRGFLSFDLTGIPTGATIDSAALDISAYAVLGQDPFQPPNVLGRFQVYSQHYGTLDWADYNGSTFGMHYDSPAGGAALAGINVTAGVQHALSLGYNRFQVRLQFVTETDGDNQKDAAEFNPGSAKLTVTYH